MRKWIAVPKYSSNAFYFETSLFILIFKKKNMIEEYFSKIFSKHRKMELIIKELIPKYGFFLKFLLKYKKIIREMVGDALSLSIQQQQKKKSLYILA